MDLKKPQNLVQALENTVREYGSKVAYHWLDESVQISNQITYSELLAESRKYAQRINEATTVGNEPFALLLFHSGIEFIIAFCACHIAGICPIPAYPPRKNRSYERLEGIIKDSRADLIITSRQIAKHSKSGIENSDLLSKLPLVIIEEYCSSNQNKVPASNIKNGKYAQTAKSQLALLQYTSGSTGNPKGVMVSHGNLMANLEDLRLYTSFESSRVMVSWLPVFHDMGLVYGVLLPLYAGSTCFLFAPTAFLKRPLLWLEIISKYKGTHTTAPNFAYDLCNKAANANDLNDLDLTTLLTAGNGAEPIRYSTLLEFSNNFSKSGFNPKAFTPCYGMAEATLIVSLAKPWRVITVKDTSLQNNTVEIVEESVSLDKKLQTTSGHTPFVSCGSWLETTDIRIIDESGKDVTGQQKIGEIFVSSKSVSQGYFNNNHATAEQFLVLEHAKESLYLATGDLGFIHEKNLYVTGRKKDLIIIRGRNYYPQDIEQTINSSSIHLQNNACAVFSVENGDEQKIIAVQEIKRSSIRKADFQQIRRNAKKAVYESHGISLDEFLIVKPGRIAKTSSGKIQRQKNKDEYHNNALHLAVPARQNPTPGGISAVNEIQNEKVDPSRNKLKQLITDWCSERFPDKHILLQNDGVFSDIGMDSVASVELIGYLEKILGKKYDDSLIYQYPTLSRLTKFLSNDSDSVEVHELSNNTDGDIAIIGYSFKLPHAENDEQLEELLKSQNTAVVPLSGERLESFATEKLDESTIHMGGFIEGAEDFDSMFFGLSPNESANIDPQHRLLLELTWKALENAYIIPESTKGRNCSVFIGLSNNDYGNLTRKNTEILHKQFTSSNSFASASNRISYFFDWLGPSITLDTACSSSLVAVHQACMSLRNGESEMSICGGANLIFDPAITESLHESGMLSRRFRCQTFDRDADGYVRSEGAGLIVLKPLKAAIENGDLIKGVIKGTSVVQDGRTNGFHAPSLDSQIKVIKRAITKSNLVPDDIDVVETHGTGTSIGDTIETKALNEVFENGTNRTRNIYLGASKSIFGHLEAASGITSVFKALLTLKTKNIHSNKNFKTLNPNIKLGANTKLPGETIKLDKKKDPLRIGVSSFGFGGTNAHIVLEEYKHGLSENESSDSVNSPFILPVTGISQQHLGGMAKTLSNICRTRSTEVIKKMAPVLALHRTHHKCRKVFFGSSKEKLLENLQINFKTHDSIPQNRQRIAFVFSGQGTDYPSMGNVLFKTSKKFKESVIKCHQYLHKTHSIDLIPTYEDQNGGKIERNTLNSQIKIFTLQYGLGEVFKSWGIKPDFVLGHSLGEYTAALNAGIIQLQDALDLIVARGSLMLKVQENTGMLNVHANLNKIKAIAKTEKYEVACINNEQNYVIAGTNSDLSKIKERLENNGVYCKMLDIPLACHTSYLTETAQLFKGAIEGINFKKAEIKFYSNVTGKSDAAMAVNAEYWANHMIKPVQFDECLTQLSKDKPTLVLDIGGNPFLATCIDEHKHQHINGKVVPTITSREKDDQSLCQVLDRCFQLGMDLDWKQVLIDLRSTYLSKSASVETPSTHLVKKSYSVLTKLPERMQTSPKAPDSSNKEKGLQYVKEDIFNFIFEKLGHDIGNIDVNSTFLELGADSIFLLNSITFIQNKYDVKLSISELFEQFNTVDKLSRHINDNMTPLANSLKNETYVEESINDKNQLRKNSRSTSSGQLESIIGIQTDAATKVATEMQAETLANIVKIQLSAVLSQDYPSEVIHKDNPLPIRQKNVPSDLFNSQPNAQALSLQQKNYLEQLINRYNKKTAKSKNLGKESIYKVGDFRNTVNFRPELREAFYPIFSEKAYGPYITDIDGNEYVDLCCGFGVNFFGHNPEFLREVIIEQVNKGFHLGTQNPKVNLLAQKICQTTKSERITFCNSGTEAVMTAIKFARAVSGKEKVVIFKNAYHGHYDGVLGIPSGNDSKCLPMAPGISSASVTDLVIFNYGDETTLEYLGKNQASIAAVIIEPVQSRNPDLQPFKFLQQLRGRASSLDIPFILDETITGFRTANGGINSILSLNADIIVYGKMIGGGLPIGIVCGKSRFIDSVDGGASLIKEQNARKTFSAGTFCKHPLAMASGLAVINQLIENGDALRKKVEQNTSNLCKELNSIFQRHQLPIEVVSFSSMFRFKYLGNSSYLFQALDMDLFYLEMNYNGVFVWEGRTCFLSTTHQEKELSRIIEAVETAATNVKDGGFFANNAANKKHASTQPTLNQVDLTEDQVEILALSKLSDEASLAFTLIGGFKLAGKLDENYIRRVVEILIAKHPILSSKINVSGKRIEENDYLNQGLNKVLNLWPTLRNKKNIGEILTEIKTRPLNMDEEPLWKVDYINIDEGGSCIIFSAHHVAVDGFSLSLLMEEFEQTYANLESRTAFDVAGSSTRNLNTIFNAFPKPDLQSETYWKEMLYDYKTNIVFPGFKYDSLSYSYSAHETIKTLQGGLSEKVKAYARKENLTPFVVLFGAYAYWIQELTGTRDIIIGIPTARREEPQIAAEIGNFANLLPIRFTEKNKFKLTDYLNELKLKLIKAYQNQYSPYATIKNALSNPDSQRKLCQITFNAERPIELDKFCEHNAKWLEFGEYFNAFELSCNWLLSEKSSQIQLIGPKNRVDKTDLDNMASGYLAVVENMVSEKFSLLNEIPILDAQAKKTLQRQLSELSPVINDHQTVNILKEDAQKGATKMGPKLFIGNKEYDHDKLKRDIGTLSGIFTALGLKEGMLICAVEERNYENLLLLLTCLEMNVTWLSLNPKHPKKLNQRIINEVTPNLICGTNNTFLVGITGDNQFFNVRSNLNYTTQIDYTTVLRNKKIFRTLVNVAYLITTSGTSGYPKTVKIEKSVFLSHIKNISKIYKYGEKDVVLQYSSLTFDAGLEQFFTPLLSGCTLIFRDEAKWGPIELKDAISKYAVTAINLPPAVLLSFCNYIEENKQRNTIKSLKLIISGGDAFPLKLARNLNRILDSKVRILNAYGPTECCVTASIKEIDLQDSFGEENLNIGKPIGGRIFLVLSPSKRVLPPGHSGELAICGTYVSSGYLHSTEGEQSFINSDAITGFDDLLRIKDLRVYLTGDIVKQNKDGNFIYSGRCNEQVSIAGMRADLVEIRNRILNHDKIKDAYVITANNEQNPEIKEIVCFCKADDLNRQSVYKYLQDYFPQQLLPSLIIVQKNLPLTNSGKLNKEVAHQLITDERAELTSNTPGELHQISADLTVETFTKLFRTAFKNKNINKNDSFISFGGNSLQAIEAVMEIKKCTGRTVSLDELFSFPTPERLHKFLYDTAYLSPELTIEEDRDSESKTSPAAIEHPKMSSQQFGIWYAHHMEGRKVEFNMAGVVEVENVIDTGRLTDAARKLISGNDVLNTSYGNNNGIPNITKNKNIVGLVKTVDISATSIEQGNNKVKEHSLRDSEKSFDLELDIPIRISVVRVINEKNKSLIKNFVAITLHHITADGWSLKTVLRSLFENYYQMDIPFRNNNNYYTYASEQQKKLEGTFFLEHQGYWLNFLKTGVNPIQLARSVSTNEQTKKKHTSVLLQLNSAVNGRINKLAMKVGLTKFEMLKSIFDIFLSKVTGQDRFITATPLANRPDPAYLNTIGLFSNLIPLESRVDAESTILDFYASNKEKIRTSIKYGEYPFSEIAALRKQLHPNSLDRVDGIVFVYEENMVDELHLTNPHTKQEFNLKITETIQRAAKNPLTLFCRENNGALDSVWEYDPNLYDKAFIKKVSTYFRQFTENVIEQTNATIADCSYLTKEDLEILQGFSQPSRKATNCKESANLVKEFKKTVTLKPSNIAVSYRGKLFTYSELDEASNHVAHYLQLKKVGKQKPFYIHIEDKFEYVKWILGILKTHNYYVPIDESNAELQIENITREEPTSIFIIDKSLPRLEELISKEENIYIPHPKKGDFTACHEIKGDDIAYMLYTSGTTNNPKAVLCTHMGIVTMAKDKGFCPFGTSTRLMPTAAKTFDASAFEIWGCLLNGATIIFDDDKPYFDAIHMSKAIETHKLTSVFLTTSLFHLLANKDPSVFKGLQNLLVGGEAMDLTLSRSVLNACSSLRLVNGYGPTENSVFTTYHECNLHDEFMVIGKPVDGTEVYVVDNQYRICGIGIPGQILITGQKLAHGYKNNHELNQRSFVKLPHLGQKSFYITGDIGRWNENGDLVFLGREDNQLKIRGNRIEVEQIELVAQDYPKVKQSIVVVRKSDDTGNALALCVVGDNINVKTLRNYIGTRLPKSHVPSEIIVRESLPLLSSGKIDRGLLNRELNRNNSIDNPVQVGMGSIGNQVFEIWKNVMNTDNVSLNENFFENGGHSLIAAKLVGMIQEHFEVELSVPAFLMHPTPAFLIQEIKNHNKENLELPVVSVNDSVDLTHSQLRIWLEEQTVSDSERTSTYNIAGMFRVEGNLTENSFRESLWLTILKHGSLRTSFPTVNGIPKQKIHDIKQAPLEVLDIHNFTDLNSIKKEFQNRLQNHLFDLASPPLFKVVAWCDYNKDLPSIKYLGIVVHHIIADAESVRIFFHELLKLISQSASSNNLKATTPSVTHLQCQTVITQKLNGVQGHKAREFWRETLKDYQKPKIPDIYKNKEVPATKPSAIAVKFDQKVVNAIEKIGKKQGSSVFNVIFAILTTVVHRLTNSDDIIIGVVSSGRNEPVTKNQIGCYLTTLPVRTSLDDLGTFKDLIKRVNRTLNDAYAFELYPLEKIINDLQKGKNPDKNPLFDFIVSFQHNAKKLHQYGNLGLLELETERSGSRSGITLDFEYKPKHLLMRVEYSHKEYSQSLIETISSCFERITQWAIQNPMEQLKHSPGCSSTFSPSILKPFQGPEVEIPETSLSEYFEKVVKQNPDATALIHEDENETQKRYETVSYAELNGLANTIASNIRNCPEYHLSPHVGIMVSRGKWMIASILGILKAGRAYVPLDPDNPSNRNDYFIEDSNVQILLTNLDRTSFDLEKCKVLNVREFRKGNDSNQAFHSGRKTDIAYIMYTSGTTGNPKGVKLTHRGCLSFVLNPVFKDLGKNDTFIQVSNYVWDGSIFDIFCSMLRGATLVIPDLSKIFSVRSFIRIIKENKVTVTLFPTALLNNLVKSDTDFLKHFRHVYFGGESPNYEVVKKAFSITGPNVLKHCYGPTECTTISNIKEINTLPEDRYISVGKPIWNCSAYILNDQLQPQKQGEIGEVYIGGNGVSSGYLNNEGKQTSFVEINTIEHKKLYKTGDSGFLNHLNELVILGRKDRQWKIRGHRIEGSEIQEHISKVIKNKEFVVECFENPNTSTKELVLFIVGPSTGDDSFLSNIQTELKVIVPVYMIPNQIVWLDKIPLNANAKTDIQALQTFYQHKIKSITSKERNDVDTGKARMFKIWENVLSKKGFTDDDNFFNLGGDSIKAIQLSAQLHQEGMNIEVKDIFQNPTVNQLLNEYLIKTNSEGHGIQMDKVDHITQYETKYPLTPIQSWFLNKYGTKLSHFNQSVLLELNLNSSLKDIRKAFDILQEKNFSLQVIFNESNNSNKTTYTQTYQEKPSKISVTTKKFADSEELEIKINEYASDMHNNISVKQNKLISAALIHHRNKQFLLVVAHHLIIDGVSWRILFDELFEILNLVVIGENSLPSVSPRISPGIWAKALKEKINKKIQKSEIDYWTRICVKKTKPLLPAIDYSDVYVKDCFKNTFQLNKEFTDLIVGQSNKNLNVQTVELLLTALNLALYSEIGPNGIRIELEGHGREQLDDLATNARTIGWFTSVYPHLLKLSKKENNLKDAIEKTKNDYRSIPNGGQLFLAIREYSNSNEFIIDKEETPEICFNYLGVLDTGNEAKDFKFSNKLSAAEISQEIPITHPITITIAVVNKHLKCDFIHPSHDDITEVCNRIFDAFKNNLEKLGQFLQKAKDTEQATNYDYSELEEEDLKDILTNLEV